MSVDPNGVIKITYKGSGNRFEDASSVNLLLLNTVHTGRYHELLCSGEQHYVLIDVDGLVQVGACDCAATQC